MDYYLSGYKLVEDRRCTHNVEVPKRNNKNKRIQKKWIKCYGYKTIAVPDMKIIVFGDKIIGHPTTIKKIINRWRAEEGDKK